MRITSHASCGPVVDIRPDGSVFLSRMTYTYKDGRTTIRHIMESGKNGQTILGTLNDGLLNEGAKDRSSFHPTVLSSDPIFIDFVRDQDQPGGTQMKVVFPVWVLPDELRDFEKVDDDDPDEKHGPVQMVGASELIRETKGRTIPFHFKATQAALYWAMCQQEAVYNYYGKLATEWTPFKMTHEQSEAVKTYLSRW